MAAPMPGAIPFASIAIAIRNRLAASLGIGVEFIHSVASDRYKITQLEPLFAYLQWFTLGKPRDPGLDFENAGAGRLFRPVGRRMRVYLYTRAGEDVYGNDDLALFGPDPLQTYATPPTYPGHFVAEEVVYNSLVSFLPVATDGTPLTIGPLHVLDSSEQPQREPEEDAGLMRSCLDFEICYSLCVDPRDPAPAV